MADPEKSEPPKKSIWAELRGAGLVIVGTLAVTLFLVYALVLHLSGRELHELGEIGDSFGALTSLFNALAFAALIATVVLQSRELRESREQLVEQAKAQKAWAAAATSQIELTKQLEAVRIRPYIKAEWHQEDNEQPTFSYQVRNVGLGVGIVSGFELRARDEHFGEVLAHTEPGAYEAWTRCLKHAVGAEIVLFSTTLAQFDDLNRALAPSEWQALAYVSLRVAERKEGLTRLRDHFRPVIHFQSGDGEEFSTLNQFDSLKAQRRPGET